MPRRWEHCSHRSRPLWRSLIRDWRKTKTVPSCSRRPSRRVILLPPAPHNRNLPMNEQSDSSVRTHHGLRAVIATGATYPTSCMSTGPPKADRDCQPHNSRDRQGQLGREHREQEPGHDTKTCQTVPPKNCPCCIEGGRDTHCVALDSDHRRRFELTLLQPEVRLTWLSHRRDGALAPHG